MPILINRLNNVLARYPHASAVMILTLLTLSVYLKVRGHEFILNWDDAVYVAENEDIRELSFRNLKRICTTSYMGNYAPMHLFSHMVEHALWGVKPEQLLLTNVALHLGSTLMFYRLLIRFGLTFPQALAAAAIFAIHPVQVESVAWISQRKNTLSMFFFLASWHSWIQWKAKDTGMGRVCWYSAAVALFALALLTKSIAVILPLFFIAQELIFERKPVTRKLLAALIPFAVLTGVCVAAALASQTHSGGGRIAHYGGSMALTMMNMLPVFSRYLTLLVFPAGLSIIYNSPIKSVPDMSILLSGTVFLLFIFGWLRLWKPHRNHFFWLTLFIIGLLPVSNIIPLVTMMNDRYLYYPMLGMAPFAVLSIDGALDRIMPRRTYAAFMIATVVILCFCIVSWHRIDVWKNPLTLWSDTLAKTGGEAWYALDANFVNYKLADTYVDLAGEQSALGNWSEARRFYYLALAYDHTNYQALAETSRLYIKRKQPLLARPFILTLIDSYKRSADGHFLMGAELDLTGETELAKEELRRALALNPQHTGAIKGLKLLEKKTAVIK
jgi:hypothetical protein